MARGGSSSSGGGCGSLIALALVIGAILAAAISLAAIVDPPAGAWVRRWPRSPRSRSSSRSPDVTRAPVIDRDDPAVRARLAAHDFERRERTARVAKALGLFALAGLGPWLAGPVPGEPATVGAILASLLLLGGGAAIWPWRWSEAEREHHTAAAIWAQIRPTSGDDAPWTRYGVWVITDGQHVELVLVSRRGTADEAVAASPFTLTAKRRLDPDEVEDAAEAMEVLRQEAADLETRAYERHRDTVGAAVRPNDAVRPLDPATDDHQRRAEVQMLREVAAEDAAERRAQASAVARALRRG